jgi:hypothetical protein
MKNASAGHLTMSAIGQNIRSQILNKKAVSEKGARTPAR